jgi:hypothetical protein
MRALKLFFIIAGITLIGMGVSQIQIYKDKKIVEQNTGKKKLKIIGIAVFGVIEIVAGIAAIAAGLTAKPA